MRLKAKQQAPDMSFIDINENEHWVGRRNIQLANVGQKTLVSFYREASCPFCNFRIYELAQKMPELSKKGLRVINIYASTEDEVQRFLARQSESMIMVADPYMKKYGAYGIEPATLITKVKALIGRLSPLIKGNIMLASTSGPVAKDSKILPADFLINSDGFIIETHYGRDIGDHISMERLESFVSD